MTSKNQIGLKSICNAPDASYMPTHVCEGRTDSNRIDTSRNNMFGKTRDIDEIDNDLTVEQFFGDEAAAAEVVRVDDLHHRVTQVEQQISSQFTSMAAYAQIAQEQIETARSEAKHATERTERRMTELIERERADRIEATGTAAAAPAAGSAWTAPDVAARLDTLERSVAEIKHGLNECLARQKALADAITALFEPQTNAGHASNTADESTLDAMTDSIDDADQADEAILPPPASSDPIGGLSIV